MAYLLISCVLLCFFLLPISWGEDLSPGRVPQFEFEHDKEFEVPLSELSVAQGNHTAWKGMEAVGRVVKKSMKQTRNIWRVRAVLLPNETAAVLKEIKGMAKDSDTAQIQDSVDQQPRYQLNLVTRGKVEHSAADIVMAAIQDRIVPYVRHHYECPTCVACDVIARRYLPGERRMHAAHFDEDAYATAVVVLHSGGYVGGLYVQPDWSAESRRYVDLRDGDAAIHQFDLNHGVDVKEGSRYSLIVWVKDGEKACATLTSPWYSRLAEAGDADAQFNLGNQYRSGRVIQKNCTAAVMWLISAAKKGHALAMSNLGFMYLSGECVKADITRGVLWNKRAAELGSSQNMIGLGKAYAGGAGGLPQDFDLAAKWFRKAFKQGEPGALELLERLQADNLGPSWLTKKWLKKQKMRSEEL